MQIMLFVYKLAVAVNTYIHMYIIYLFAYIAFFNPLYSFFLYSAIQYMIVNIC